MRSNPDLPRPAILAGLALLALSGFGRSMAVAQMASSSMPGNQQKWKYAELTKVPEKARAKPNPMETDPEANAAGGKLFGQHCAECHGKKAEGGKKAPSLLRAEVQQAAPGSLFWILTNGVVWHGMPVWSKLPEPQRWQIVTFLKSLGTSSSSPKQTDPE
jgi:mono/diheme cytochrome c family protein